MEKFGTGSAKSVGKDYDFERHVNLSVRLNRWMLRPMGVWPVSTNVSGLERCLCRLLNVVCYGLMTFLFVPCALYIVLEVKELYDKLKLVAPLNFCGMALVKYYSIMFHGDDIRECVKRIEWDWRNLTYFMDRDIMIANANFGRRMVTVCTFFMYSGFVFYFIAIPISTGSIEAEDGNFTFFPMVFPVTSYIIDTRRSPTNKIFVAVQFLAGILIHAVTVAACSLAAIFAAHACGQMDVLICWLEHLIDGRPDMCDDVDVRIANVVRQHVRVLKFLELTEKAMRQISFVEFLGSTLNLCLVGYYIIMEWDPNDLTVAVTYIILLVSLTFNIFIFCYIGELVAEKCKKVGEMSYMIEWHRLKGSKKLCFILIIAMSNSSIKLTAGNMIVLSLTSFGDVVKTSVAYLNMLRTLT